MPSTLFDAILRALEANANASPLSSSSAPFASLFSRASPRAAEHSSLFEALRNPAPAVPPGLSQTILKAITAKPKVFVSYHHEGDRQYYYEFTRMFGDSYDVCHDNSVDRIIDSDDSDYVIRTIREEYLTGTSCTIVLCGAQTRWRKFVDWEIKASLDKQHALIGVNLPTNPCDSLGRFHKPDRLQDNIDSGFALWVEWNALVAGGPAILRTSLQTARLTSRATINNDRGLRKRNG